MSDFPSELSPILFNTCRSGHIRQLSFTDRVAVRAAVASKAFWDDDGDDGRRPHSNPVQERSRLRYSPATGYGALVVCDLALIFCGLEQLPGAGAGAGAASKRSGRPPRQIVLYTPYHLSSGVWG